MKRSAKMIGQSCVLAVALVLLPLTHTAAAEITPDQVRAFVHNVYIEGVPYEQASQLSADVALPVLAEVLNDPRQEDAWANAAVTIGMIGNDRGEKLLTDFITRREANVKLTRAQTVAKTSAVMALGYIVNKTGNSKALKFLIEGVNPQAWNKRKIGWNGAFHATNAERDKQLASMAILGLGVSGNAEASKALEALKAAPTTPKMRKLKSDLPEINSMAEEALKANRAISSNGLKNYYQKIQPKYSPDENKILKAPESGVIKSPVAGEIVKPLQPGDVLRQSQPGEVVSPMKAGEVLKPLQKGEIIKVE